MGQWSEREGGPSEEANWFDSAPFWDVAGQALKREIIVLIREQIEIERKHMVYHRRSGDIVNGVIDCPSGCGWLTSHDEITGVNDGEAPEWWARQMAESDGIRQVNRHRSCEPFEWFGPASEPMAASRDCPCGGCHVRFRYQPKPEKPEGDDPRAGDEIPSYLGPSKRKSWLRWR